MSSTTNTSSSSTTTGKGRRRRRLADEGEEGISPSDNKDSNGAARPSECESEGEGPDIGSELSEYESAHESADQEEETEEGSDSETETGSETESGSETETEGGDGYTDEEGLDQERQSGDGEEQPDNEKPDDDEDKKNPAYVPRRGAFYEHDFRQGDKGVEGEEEEEVTKEPAKPVKKLWQEESKWAHDRYISDLQAPKTREELIALYGYDIRAADKPPEAPPKRMGGGGNQDRRERKFQDFMPRMAVIDTTEDGADSVPNLGGENFIPYNKGPGRHGNNRSDSGRARRGGPRGGGSGGNYRNSNTEGYGNRYRQEGGSRFNDGPSQDARISDGKYSNTGGTNDFPSLQESAYQRERRDGQRSSAYDRLRRDEDFGDDRRDRRHGQMESRRGGGNRRGGYGDGGDNRGYFSNSQDARRDNENWRSGPHSYNQERGSNNRRGGPRPGDQSRGARDENWRSGTDPRGNFNKGDTFKQDQRDNRYGGGDGTRGPRMGGSGDYKAQPERPAKYGHGQGYEQPPRYQQMSQEFTNTAMRAGEDRQVVAAQRGQGGEAKKLDGAVENNTNAQQNAGDISKNVVVSSSHEKGQREKVQTINVTITSTTTEKKSYAKERRAKGAPVPEGSVPGAAVDVKRTGPPNIPPQSVQYQQQQHQHTGGSNLEAGSVSLQAQGKRYSSQRQQAIASRPFTEPPPPTADSGGTKLYNPALPPPPFYPRDQPAAASSVPPPTVQQPPLPPAVGVPDAARFTPTMLPPVTVPLQYPLPVSNAGLALPPSAGGVSVNPAIFQQAAPPPPPSQGNLPAPPPGTPIMAPPFLPAGMIYSGSPRVPPPHNAAQAPPFPLPMAYTSPPPQAPVAPPAQGVPQQGAQSSAQPQHKVYRGDITYYAPELQQPPRVPQKRPKAAIPIIDPQVIREQKRKERSAYSQSGSTKVMPDPHIKFEADPSIPLEQNPPEPSAAVKQEMRPVVSDEAKVGGGGGSAIATETCGTAASSVAPVKQEAPLESKGSITPEPVVPSQPAAAVGQTVSIVAVDSRPPLTIVQSFSEPPETVAAEKGIASLDLKKETESGTSKVVDTGAAVSTDQSEAV